MKRLFIIGAMRSGSSSIATYLKQHPDVISSSVKEPNFMIFFQNDHKYLRSDKSPLRLKKYAMELESYEALYSEASLDAVAIDASSSYISYPHAAKNIKKLYPNAYILATLRNPVERAISAYKFNKARGTDTRENFIQILTDEINGKDENIFAPWRYIHCGKYEENLKPYFDEFPKEQIFLQDFEGFKNNPIESLGAITEFLNLSRFEYDVSFKVNSSTAPNRISRFLNKILINNSMPVKVTRSMIKKTAPDLKTVDVLAKLEKSTSKRDEAMTRPNYHVEKTMLEAVFAEQAPVSLIVNMKADT